MGGGERGAAGGDAGVAAGAGGGDGYRVEWAFDEHRAGAADQGVAGGGVGTEAVAPVDRHPGLGRRRRGEPVVGVCRRAL